MAYQDALAKYERAQKHIQDFKIAVDTFRDANRDHVGVKVDEQTGDIVYYVKSVPVVPTEISLLLGDALHNLRSALDHLAHAIVRPTTPTAIKDTFFPIADTADGYCSMAGACIKGIRQPCRQIFDRIQPYKGGGFGHYLWQLNKLDVIDKHRLLLTVSFAPSGRTLTPSEREKANAKFNRFGNLVRLSIPHGMVSSDPAPSFPLYEGQILFTVPAAETEHQMGFSFDVALHEPEVAKTASALLLLNFISSEVGTVIGELAPCATIH